MLAHDKNTQKAMKKTERISLIHKAKTNREREKTRVQETAPAKHRR